jgi:hypothetical protein
MTEKDLDRGFSECTSCDSGIRLLQAGFDIKTYVCAVCREEVADRDDFTLMNGVAWLSK